MCKVMCTAWGKDRDQLKRIKANSSPLCIHKREKFPRQKSQLKLDLDGNGGWHISFSTMTSIRFGDLCLCGCALSVSGPYSGTQDLGSVTAITLLPGIILDVVLS